MEPEYKELRECIYTNQEELDRFRQLVVNSVMATDIVDKELGGLRKKRWDMAFQQHDEDDAPESSPEPNTNVDINRKATIVIEHLIQVRHRVLPRVCGDASLPLLTSLSLLSCFNFEGCRRGPYHAALAVST